MKSQVHFSETAPDIYLRIDVVRISEDQALQVSLPLKDGGCGLRTHTISELRRLFVSSAMLIAPAVEAATGFRVGERPAVDDLAAEISPFDACLEVCASHLENDLGISRPDCSRAGPIQADVWAYSASKKLIAKNKEDLSALSPALPQRECKRAQARLRSCSGVGAQWLACAHSFFHVEARRKKEGNGDPKV